MAGLYVKLDASYEEDDKIIAAGEKAEVLFVRGLCMAKRTLSDGFIADVQLPRFHLPGVQQRALTLCEVGLWRRDEERKGYWIVRWLAHNPSREQVEATSRRRAAAGSKGGQARAQANGQTPVEANGKQVAYPEAEAETEAETKAGAGGNRLASKQATTSAACRLLAEKAADVRPRDDRERWVQATTRGKLKDHADVIDACWRSSSDWTPESLAEALEPSPQKPRIATCPLCGDALDSNHTDAWCRHKQGLAS